MKKENPLKNVVNTFLSCSKKIGAWRRGLIKYYLSFKKVMFSTQLNCLSNFIFSFGKTMVKVQRSIKLDMTASVFYKMLGLTIVFTKQTSVTSS